jgi:hypothetical protein
MRSHKKDSDIPGVIRVHCNRCDHETVHSVLAGDLEVICEPIPGTDREEIVGDHLRLVCMCQGCGNKCFANAIDHYEKGLVKNVYPHQVLRKVPRWYYVALQGMTWDALGLLSEIYGALHVNALRIAAMGIRAAFEQIFVETVGDYGSFAKNLDEFQNQGFISLLERNAVNTVLDVGHAAIHRSHSPTQQDIFAMLDVLEHLIQALYVNNKIAGTMSPTPARKRIQRAKP